MTISKFHKVFFLVVVAGFMHTIPAAAQFSIDLDLNSRYIWRGTDFGNSPSIQPAMSYAMGGLEVGLWGAYATNGDPAGSEVDLWVSYTFNSDAGSFSVYATDYTFPIHHTGMTEAAETWLDSDAHTIELGLGYAGTDELPVSVFAGMFVHNDEDYSMYVELGYDADPVEFFLGFSPFESAAYGTTGVGIVNLGITGSKELIITENLSIGLSSSLIANIDAENIHMLVGISF
ncbi:MAG: hypothetical protein WD097_08000 [Balneolales bacterium]